MGFPPFPDVLNTIVNKSTWNPASIAAGAEVSTTVTVPGAKVGDVVLVGFNPTAADVVMSAWVSAANTVYVNIANPTAGAVDPASQTLTLVVYGV